MIADRSQIEHTGSVQITHRRGCFRWCDDLIVVTVIQYGNQLRVIAYVCECVSAQIISNV